jgi:hypothetical protein
MAFTTASKDTAVNSLTATGTWIALFTADPGTVGSSNEVSGGSYARQQTTWGSSSSGTAAGSQVTFSSVPSGSYTHYGVFTAQTGGTFRWGFALSPGVTLSASGTVLMTPRVTFP